MVPSGESIPEMSSTSSMIASGGEGSPTDSKSHFDDEDGPQPALIFVPRIRAMNRARDISADQYPRAKERGDSSRASESKADVLAGTERLCSAATEPECWRLSGPDARRRMCSSMQPHRPAAPPLAPLPCMGVPTSWGQSEVRLATRHTLARPALTPGSSSNPPKRILVSAVSVSDIVSAAAPSAAPAAATLASPPRHLLVSATSVCATSAQGCTEANALPETGMRIQGNSKMGVRAHAIVPAATHRAPPAPATPSNLLSGPKACLLKPLEQQQPPATPPLSAISLALAKRAAARLAASQSSSLSSVGGLSPHGPGGLGACNSGYGQAVTKLGSAVGVLSGSVGVRAHAIVPAATHRAPPAPATPSNLLSGPKACLLKPLEQQQPPATSPLSAISLALAKRAAARLAASQSSSLSSVGGLSPHGPGGLGACNSGCGQAATKLGSAVGVLSGSMAPRQQVTPPVALHTASCSGASPGCLSLRSSGACTCVVDCFRPAPLPAHQFSARQAVASPPDQLVMPPSAVVEVVQLSQRSMLTCQLGRLSVRRQPSKDLCRK